MKAGIFSIYKEDQFGHWDWVEIRGYPVSLPQLPGVVLFVHHPINYAGQEVKRLWRISEGKSGSTTNSLGHADYPTMKAAIRAIKQAAKKYPERYNIRFYRRQLRRIMKIYPGIARRA